MSRNTSGVYSKPAGTTAVPGDDIDAATFNTLIDDIVSDLNLARPITAGGTGASTAAGARTNLGITGDDATARTYATFTELSATEIAADVKRIAAQSYSTAIASPPILLKRVDSEPSHPGKVRTTDRYLSTGATDATNGGWWEFFGLYVTPRQLGCAGNGTTTDNTAFQSFIDVVEATELVGEGDPGATYKLTATRTVDSSDVILRGNGATIDFDGDNSAAGIGGFQQPAGEWAIGIDGSTARVSNVEISGWVFDMAIKDQVAVYAERASHVRVERNRVENGGVFFSTLNSGSAGWTGASWDATAPDVSAIVAADLSEDVWVVDNIVTLPADDSAAAVGIAVHFTDGGVIRGNKIYGGRHCIRWIGGDANSTRDGGVGSTRWVKNLRITGNQCSDGHGAGIWGSQGESIVVEGNTCQRFSDLCIDDEGGYGNVFTGNTCEDGQNGALGVFFICENLNVTGNTFRVTDSSIGNKLLRQNLSSDDEAFSVNVSGNVWECLDETVTGVLQWTRSASFNFTDNKLVNCVLNMVTTNGGDRFILNNTFDFPVDPEAHGISISGGLWIDEGERDIRNIIKGNVMNAYGWNGSGLQAFIYTGAGGANGNDQTNTIIEANQLHNYYNPSSSNHEGFPASMITEATNGIGVHRFMILYNGVTNPNIVDISDKAGIGFASLNNRVFHKGTYSLKERTPYAAPPTNGVYVSGSTLDHNNPEAGGFEGWIVAGTNRVNAPTSGTYDAGTDYAAFAQIDYSTEVYIATKANGPSSVVVTPGGGSKTYDPPSLADGATDTTTVTVTGARSGDEITVDFSTSLPSGYTATGEVTADDTVTVTFANNSGGAVDAASGTLTAYNQTWRRLTPSAYTFLTRGTIPLNGSETWNPGSIADGAKESIDITVTGARLGDYVMVSFSLDLQELVLSGAVRADDTVEATLYNNTGGAVDLGSGTVSARVWKD